MEGFESRQGIGAGCQSGLGARGGLCCAETVYVARGGDGLGRMVLDIYLSIRFISCLSSFSEDPKTVDKSKIQQITKQGLGTRGASA